MANKGSRPRAPTITIDTSSTHGPADSTEDIQLEATQSLSPQHFLAVPDNASQPRRSFDSEGHTFVGTPSQHSSRDEYSPPTEGDPLKPDPGEERYFNVENNKFAFSPGQLTKLIPTKNPDVFYALGGPIGLERGLRTDFKHGLDVKEQSFSNAVSFQEATSGVAVPTLQRSESLPAAAAQMSRTDTNLEKLTASQQQALFADRKRVFSDNRLPERKSKSIFELMWMAYKDKILILLSIAAAVSLAVGIYQTVSLKEPVQWVEGVAILVAIIIVVVVGAVNDWQKERQFVKLNKRKSDRFIKAIRSGKTREISVFDVLVGDIVLLEQGDMVPVDGIFLAGHNVTCDESSATGESDLLKKTPAKDVYAAMEAHKSIRKMDPFILSGAKVTEGLGTFVVTATGVNSSYGKLMMSLRDEGEVTPLQSKLNVLAEYIAKLGSAAALLYFVVAFIEFLVHISPHGRLASATSANKGQQFLNIFVTAVSVIVVAVPEGLPLAVTLALAFATTRMLKDNNLVRLLRSCETMGGATTVCSDKTGTLTQNSMTVVSGFIGSPSTRFGVGTTSSKLPEAVAADIFVKTMHDSVFETLEKSIALNTTAFESEDGFVGSKTETALLTFAREHLELGDIAEQREGTPVLQLVPFDSKRKCMGIVVRTDEGARLYVKGAPEMVLAKCRRIVDATTGDAIPSIDSKNFDEQWKLILTYASRSLRTLGFSYKDFPSWPPERVRKTDPDQVEFDDIFNDMTFLGVVGIQDPVRPGVPEAVKQCNRAGIFVRMVTGDNLETAKAIGKECGILTEGGLAIEGPEFRQMSKAQVREILPTLQILARSSPEDKRRLVKQLKELRNTVAVTGDGTNDAPALKTADVGFSMGIAGTEVAKEASAIILMDDNFSSIVKAIMWGRAVNDAVKKFLQFQITVNISAVLITFVSGISGKVLYQGGTNMASGTVLSPVQLLWINLIMDTMAALALATDPPTESILDRPPDHKGANLITVTMWKMILGQAVYQLVVIFVLFFAGARIFSYQTNEEHKALQTLIFNTFVWMQIFNAFNNRRLDNRFNIFEGVHRNWLFILMITIMCGAQVLIVFIGGSAISIPHTLNGSQWGYSLVLGFLSLPIAVMLRLIPDDFLLALIPESVKKMGRSKLSISDEEAQRYEWNTALTDVRNELVFLKKYKGGRLNNMRYKVREARDALPVPRPSSNRSRSSTNRTLPSAAVAAGIVAGSIAGWSPVERPADKSSDSGTK
ncbi:MAG: hypothetical protein M1828_006468 [Chrysothrix sp. TS-e1954]|nr:MAG: hypothetical protein M1828_006468 [Chrysothrix sp. TS-e1954]